MEKQYAMKSTRSSNFEMLRIVSILLIIAFHYFCHADYGRLEGAELSVNKVLAILLGSWGPLGVDCFLFISIYFSLDLAMIKWNKCVKICCETIGYSVFYLPLYRFGRFNFLTVLPCRPGKTRSCKANNQVLTQETSFYYEIHLL